ncbi:MAG: Na+/H+ antiporter subunit E [Myxococcota bacterium]
MLRTLITAAVLSSVWVLWSWHFEPLVVGVAVFSIVFVVAFTSRMGILDVEGQPYEINLRLLRYVPWLCWEVVKANFAVARIILSPEMKIRPHLIRVPASQRTSIGRVIYANTITLTPGTISLDIRDGVILVHALSDDLASQEGEDEHAAMIRWLEANVPDDPPDAELIGTDEQHLATAQELSES